MKKHYFSPELVALEMATQQFLLNSTSGPEPPIVPPDDDDGFDQD